MPHLARVVFFLAFLLAPTAYANAALGVEVTFSVGEAATIRAYYEDGHSQSPNKGRKQKSLPPGIARNLARGKALPPGIAKQVLPTDLVSLLPAAPKGYERIYVSGKVLLVEIATQVIHDVLEDVFLR
jgi:hypothetical protein